MKAFLSIFALVAALTFGAHYLDGSFAEAHPGKLAKDGCHNDRASGIRHRHSGGLELSCKPVIPTAESQAIDRLNETIQKFMNDADGDRRCAETVRSFLSFSGLNTRVMKIVRKACKRE